MIAIFKKELRDCLKWVPAGMVIAVVMVWLVLPERIDMIYLVEQTLMGSITFAAALIAFAFGLLQSLFDTRNGARGYLLHRPVDRSHIFWAKIASGVCGYVLSLIPAFLLAVFYLRGKGLEFLPVSGWQVIPSVLMTLAAFLLHPVGLWIGNRDARWVGTRVLPLAGIVAVLMAISRCYTTDASVVPAYFQALLIGAIWLIQILALVLILAAAKHAFCHRQMLPPASGENSSSRASISALTFSSVVVATVVVMFIVDLVNPAVYINNRRELLMNRAGEFQQVHIERPQWFNELVKTRYSVRPAAESKSEFVPVDEHWELPEYSVVTLAERKTHSWFDQFASFGFFGSDTTMGGRVHLFSNRGRLLAYDRNKLTAVTTPQGVSRKGELPSGQFEDVALPRYVKSGENVNGYLLANPLMVDATGLLQLDTDTFEANRLITNRADRLCMLLGDGRSPATLWTASGETLTQNVVSAIDEKIQLTAEAVIRNGSIDMPMIKVEDSKTYKINVLDDRSSLSVFRSDAGRYGYVRYNFNTKEHFYGMLAEDGSVEQIGPVFVPSIKRPNRDAIALAIPPAFGYFATVYTLFLGQVGEISLWGGLAFAAMQSALAAIGTFWLCSFYDLSRRGRLVWIVVAFIAGWGVCLAVAACYRRLVKEVCSHCRQATRVDLETCTHCAKPWLPSEMEQIEIFDSMVEAA